MTSKVIQQPARYENVHVNGLDGVPSVKPTHPKPHRLETHVSEPNIKVGEGLSADSASRSTSTNHKAAATPSKSPAGSAKSEHAIREAKYKLLIPVQAPADKGGECAQCKELSQILALWELGVGGIARNCSKILAQLNQARNAHQALEYRLQEKVELESSAAPTVTKSLNVNRTQKANYRKSLYTEREGASNGTSGNNYLVEQMYPDKAGSPGMPEIGSGECVNLPYEHYLQLLNTHLGQAIDLCQQLAAACFKSNQSVSTTVSGDTPRLRRQPTAPTVRATATPKSTNSPAATSYQPPLQPVAEEKPSPPSSKLHHRANFIRTSSSPGICPTDDDDVKHSESDSELQNPLRESERLAKKMLSSGELDESWVRVEGAVNGAPLLGKEVLESKAEQDSKSDSSSTASSKSPFHNPALSVLGATEQKKLAKEAQKSDTDELTELVLSSSSYGSENVRDSILSTYSDNDVKQVMSKIASLEEERIKLLDTIDKLHKDNQLVRFPTLL